jgi:predicted MFS family arabinose efflux permease
MAGKRADRYWTRVFIPTLLIILAFFVYLLFTLPQSQMIPAASIFRAIGSVTKNEDPR